MGSPLETFTVHFPLNFKESPQLPTIVIGICTGDRTALASTLFLTGPHLAGREISSHKGKASCVVCISGLIVLYLICYSEIRDANRLDALLNGRTHCPDSSNSLTVNARVISVEGYENIFKGTLE